MYIVEGEMYMKKIGSFIWNIIVIAWLIVAIFVTVCLLSYNDYRVIKFGNSSLLIMDSDELEPDFHEGDLLIVKRNSDKMINVNYNAKGSCKMVAEAYLDTMPANKKYTLYDSRRR